MSSMASTSNTSVKKKKLGKSGLSGNHGKSEVWNIFDKVMDEESKKWLGECKCRYCNLVVFSPSNLGTNKLWTHRDHCQEIPVELKDKTQSIVNLFGGAIVNWKFDQEKCRRACAIMIIMAELPFCFVEEESFRAFCAEMQPRFHVVSRPTITKDCYKIFFEEKEKLRRYLKETSTRVSITTDMWTSIQNLGYIVVTAHFVDKSWKLQKRILNFRVVPHPHKGEVISKVIESCLLEWGLEKIMTITLDNARNNDTCVSDLIRRLNKREMLLLGGEFFHVRCFAHIINLVVRDGIDEVNDVVKRLRRSVKYVRSSPSRLQSVKKCVEEEKLACKRHLCMDVKTRWNSTYHMIDSALPFEKAFDRLEEQDPIYKNECQSLSLDWVKLKRLHLFLADFYVLTKRISSSHYVSSHTYFDEVTHIIDKLQKQLDKDDDHCAMAKKMQEKFEKYCHIEKLNPIFLASVVLDPRNKLDYLELWFDDLLGCDRQLTDETRQKKVDELVLSVRLFLSRLYNRYKVEPMTIEDIENSSLVGEVTKEGDGYEKRDAIRAKLKRKSTLESMNDLEKYLHEGVENGGPNFDILGWWKDKVPTYHALAIMARDILSVPMTSVASESAFSGAGRVLDPFRSSLTPKIVEGLVCAQDWLRGGAMPTLLVEEKTELLVEIEKSVHEFQTLAINE